MALILMKTVYSEREPKRETAYIFNVFYEWLPHPLESTDLIICDCLAPTSRKQRTLHCFTNRILLGNK